MLEMAPEVVDKGFLLSSLRHFIDGLELDFARYAAEFDQSKQWDEEGFNNPADWMRFNCHMNSQAAWNALGVGEHEARLSQSIDALRAGEIGFAHLATMGRTADQMGQAFDESKLLPLAKENSPGKFYYKVLHYKHSVDAGAYNRAQEELAEERSLRLSTAEDGCLLISGVLDPIGGAAVRSALEPLAQPSGAHDDRSREQRLADALVERLSGGQPANLQALPAQPRRGDPANDEDPEGSGRRRGGRDGVLFSYLLQLSPADGLRLQRHPGPAQPGVGDDRRRALQASDLGRTEPGFEGSRWSLPVAGLRALGLDVRRPSPGALDKRRADRPRQSRPALSAASSDGARGRLADDQNPRSSSRHDRADDHLRVAARAGLGTSLAHNVPAAPREVAC